MRGYKLDACEVSQVDERVRTTAETYALGVIDDVSAVLAGDAVEQWLVVIASRRGHVHEVETGLVEGYGVGGGQYTHILHLWRSRSAVAVAIHANVVHHINVDDVLAFLMEILMDGVGNLSHRLKEAVLVIGIREPTLRYRITPS